jgi:hypothetical protein
MNKLRIVFLVGIIIVVGIFNSVLAAYGQGTSLWTPAQPIPLYVDAYPPILVADQNRTVHAFNSEAQDDGKVTIYYRQWNIDKGWSLPADVLLTFPSASDALQAVELDPAGKFHVVYYNGDQFGGDIMYSRAWASDAGRSQAWSEPIEIGTEASPLISAALSQFGDNHLSLVYSGDADGVALYETHSDDGGDTWTKPIRITPVNAEGMWPVHIQTAFDEQGVLHVVWGVVGESGIGQKVYYTNRGVDGMTWRNAYLLAAAEGNDYGADWPSIIYYKDQLIAMYMDGTIPNGVPPTRWMRLSKDGGKTWSVPVRPFPQVGENGRAVLLIDSNNTLHIILANRVGDPAVGGIWHGVWIGDQWGELELITPPSSAAAINSGSYAEANQGSRPNAVILQGNTLLAAWWHDIPGARVVPPAGYSYTRINSPELPIVPLPEVTLTPTTSAVPMIVPMVTPTTVSITSGVAPVSTVEFGNNENNSRPISVASILFLGLFPALVLTVVVLSAYRIHNRTNRS